MADTLISYTILDADGDKREIHVFVPAARTQAEIAAFNTFYAPLLDAVIDGQILSGSYTIELTLPGGVKAAPVALSEAQKGALLSFDNASRYNWGVYVPTFKPTLFSGNDLNLGGAGVASFIDAFVTGDGTVAPTNGFAFDLTALSKSRKAHRK